MKKLIAWALALALLCGCAVAELPEEEGPQPVLPPAETTPLAPAVTETDRFSRTEIIRRNESAEGYFLTAQTWALAYAEECWPGSECAAEYVSGFAAPAAMFTDSLSGGSTLWRATVSQSGGHALEESIQVLYFQDGGQIYLSAVLAGEQVLSGRAEALAYLRLDPRFSARMCELPALTPPEGAARYDLTALLGEGEQMASAFLLDAQTAVVHNVGYASDQPTVAVLELASGERLAEQVLPAGNWQEGGLRDGAFVLEQLDENGALRRLCRCTADGIELSAAAEGDRRLRVGTRILEQREGSIWVSEPDETGGWSERELLAGGGTGLSATRYLLREGLSDERFLFDQYGYEWVERSGVYDLATGEQFTVTIPVTAEGTTRRLSGYLLWSDGTSALAAVSDYGYYAFVRANFFTGAVEPVEVGCPDGANMAEQVAVGPYGNNLLLLRPAPEGSRDCTVELYGLTGTLLWSWSLDTGMAASVSIQLCGGQTVAVRYFDLSTGHEMLVVAPV